MHATRCSLLAVLIMTMAMLSLAATAQVVTATVPAGTDAFSAAVNSTTNVTYIANFVCPSSPCPGPGTVTAINGASNNPATVNVGVIPYALAVNSTTNKIFVVNECGNDVNCNSAGTVSVINGATNGVVASVTVGWYPVAVGIDTVTNKVYVVNECGDDPSCSSSGTVTVINAGNNYSTATVNAGIAPQSVAVNPASNHIYVANQACFNFPSCPSAGTVTVINGTNNSTQTVSVGVSPYYLALNSVTNKIYVSNDCGNDTTCSSPGTVTVIDGATNETSTINVGAYPEDIAVNSTTNQVYVANNCGSTACNTKGTVTVINANNNYSTTTVNVDYHPVYLDIDSVANKVHVANACGNDVHCQSPGTITVIDGVTNSTFAIAVGDQPDALATNPSTHNVYVPNFQDGTVSVIGGNAKLQLVNVTPCRLVDTRHESPIQGGTFESFAVPRLGGCNIPTTAAAYSLNVTVVPHGPLQSMTVWPTPERQPTLATMSSTDGRVRTNAMIVPAGASGAVSVYVSRTSDVILDINGYFLPAVQNSYQFYPLTPCRVINTSSGHGLFSGPYLSGGVERDFPMLASDCIPPGMNPQAYSLNIIVEPHQAGQSLTYVTAWAKGHTRPDVPTLSDPTGTRVSNAAIVAAGSGGGIAVYPTADADMVVDINGYFAEPGQGGLSFYPSLPCRALDTGNNRLFDGGGSLRLAGSMCEPGGNAEAYLLNATVVPLVGLQDLTVWPNDQPRPDVTTLSVPDGGMTSNIAIVPTTNGAIDGAVSDRTELIVDLYGYFAP